MNELERILLEPGGGQTSAWRWATVTQVDPLRVRIDGESSELNATPISLVDKAGLSAGDRVWVQLAGRRLIVHGSDLVRNGGPHQIGSFPTAKGAQSIILRRTSAQTSITGRSWTRVLWNNIERHDQDAGSMDPGGGNGMNYPIQGYYLLTANVSANVGSADFFIRIVSGVGTVVGTGVARTPLQTATASCIVYVSTTWGLHVEIYINATGTTFQTYGDGGATPVRFMGVRIL